MMRSLFAGVSGTRVHQTRMDVIGNNIANVNTVGFKFGRVTFQDMLSQTLRGAAKPTNDRGGIDPMQVGLGVAIRSIDTVFTPGNVEYTGKLTDMAIQGNGFFVVRDSGGGNLYTRDGAFKLDPTGHLVHPSTGFRVLGWTANNGVVDTKAPAGPVTVSLGKDMKANATTKVSLVGNLDSTATIGDAAATPPVAADTWEAVVPVYDSKGNQTMLTVTFERTANLNWKWTASADNATTSSQGTLEFDAAGKLANSPNNDVAVTGLPNGALPLSIKLDFASLSELSGPTTVNWSTQDGFPPGTLETFNIDDRGVMTGVYSNGQYETVGQIALAGFSNPEGLTRIAGNMFAETTNSGPGSIGAAGSGGRGTIAGSSIEMSNVDLSTEFTNMIVTQRGFQANSRVITAADEMLQELLTLKR